MKKQTKSNWQTTVFAVIAAVVFMLAANSPASAQTTYKVGDRIEAMSAGKWFEAEVLEVKSDGDYVIRYITDRIEETTREKWLRPLKAKVQTDKQNNADNRTQNQTDGNNRADNKTPKPNPAQTDKTNRFEARDPRTCENTKAPAKGAITAALAIKYLNCQMEGAWGSDLYLVENVKVEVGGGIPYAAIMGQRSLSEIDVKYPVYPIRGSFLKYQCREVTGYATLAGENCTTYNQPKATGYCYKTTFGDWRCNMADQASKNDANIRHGVAPPKP